MTTMREALTPRQCEMMEHVASGAGYDEVAAAMYVSFATVKTTMKNIAMRLDEPGVNRTGLAVRWVREGHAAMTHAARVSLREAHHLAVQAGEEDIAALLAETIAGLE